MHLRQLPFVLLVISLVLGITGGILLASGSVETARFGEMEEAQDSRLELMSRKLKELDQAKKSFIQDSTALKGNNAVKQLNVEQIERLTANVQRRYDDLKQQESNLEGVMAEYHRFEREQNAEADKGRRLTWWKHATGYASLFLGSVCLISGLVGGWRIQKAYEELHLAER